MHSGLICIVMPPCIVIMYFCFQTHVVYLCKPEEIKNLNLRVSQLQSSVVVYAIEFAIKYALHGLLWSLASRT